MVGSYSLNHIDEIWDANEQLWQYMPTSYRANCSSRLNNWGTKKQNKKNERRQGYQLVSILSLMAFSICGIEEKLKSNIKSIYWNCWRKVLVSSSRWRQEFSLWNYFPRAPRRHVPSTTTFPPSISLSLSLYIRRDNRSIVRNKCSQQRHNPKMKVKRWFKHVIQSFDSKDRTRKKKKKKNAPSDRRNKRHNWEEKKQKVKGKAHLDVIYIALSWKFFTSEPQSFRHRITCPAGIRVNLFDNSVISWVRFLHLCFCLCIFFHYLFAVTALKISWPNVQREEKKNVRRSSGHWKAYRSTMNARKKKWNVQRPIKW